MTPFKHVFQLLFSAVIFSLVAFSCSQESVKDESISDEEAIELIESMVISESGSFSKNMDDIAKSFFDSLDLNTLCNAPFNKTIAEDFDKEGVSGSYESQVAGEVVCNSLNIPESVTINAKTIANLDDDKMTSNTSSEFVGHISGLDLFSPFMTVSSTFKANGNQIFKGEDFKTVISEFEMQTPSLDISKFLFEIHSGTSTFTFSGTSNDIPFSYVGTIEFLGENKAILTFNGKTYELDWK